MRLPNGTTRKTRRSYNEPGHAHELTFSCFGRLPLLGRERARRWVIDALGLARKKHHLELWAYVIMPEHLHVLFLSRRASYDIARILQTIKQPVARRTIAWLKASDPAWLARLNRAESAGQARYHFWQSGGGYDRNIANIKTAWAVVDYIHNNPVRRGLVQHSTEWAWSSARWYARREDVLLPMDGVPTD
jgi:putative transposase